MKKHPELLMLGIALLGCIAIIGTYSDCDAIVRWFQ